MTTAEGTGGYVIVNGTPADRRHAIPRGRGYTAEFGSIPDTGRGSCSQVRPTRSGSWWTAAAGRPRALRAGSPGRYGIPTISIHNLYLKPNVSVSF